MLSISQSGYISKVVATAGKIPVSDFCRGAVLLLMRKTIVTITLSPSTCHRKATLIESISKQYQVVNMCFYNILILYR